MDFSCIFDTATIHLAVFFNSGGLDWLLLSCTLKDLTSGEYFVSWKIKNIITYPGCSHHLLYFDWGQHQCTSTSTRERDGRYRWIYQNEAWLLQVAIASSPNSFLRGHQGVKAPAVAPRPRSSGADSRTKRTPEQRPKTRPASAQSQRRQQALLLLPPRRRGGACSCACVD